MCSTNSKITTSGALSPPNISQSDPSPSAVVPSLSSRDVKHLVGKTYNILGPRYLSWSTHHNPTRLHYLRKLLPHLTRHRESQADVQVLELGCGAGIPTTQLLAAQPGIHVTGNDISSTQLALAVQNLPAASVTLIEGDMMDLEFADGKFDAVVAMYSLIHLPREEQRVLMERMARWLKSGGWLLVNFGAAGAEQLFEADWLGEKGAGMFWSGWGVEGSREMVTKAGLEIRVDDVLCDIDEGEAEKKRKVPFWWGLAEKPSEDRGTDSRPRTNE